MVCVGIFFCLTALEMFLMSSTFVKLCTAQYVTQMSVLLLLSGSLGEPGEFPVGWSVFFVPCELVFSHGTDFKNCILWSRAACSESSLVVDIITF